MKRVKDFDAIITLLTQYIEEPGPVPSMKIVSVAQTTCAKWQKTSTNNGTFKEIEEVVDDFAVS